MDSFPKTRIFILARNISKHSDYRIKVGCVILKGNRIISIGFNKLKYNKVWCNPERKTLHAEASAIKTSGKNKLKNGIAYIYREKHDGSIGLARPCSDCMKKLKDFGIKTIYYSIDEYPYYNVEDIS